MGRKNPGKKSKGKFRPKPSPDKGNRDLLLQSVRAPVVSDIRPGRCGVQLVRGHYDTA